MLMILPPPPRAIIARAACFEHRNVPVRWLPITASQSSRDRFRTEPPRNNPALLTRTSSRPSRSTTCASARSTAASSRTSSGSTASGSPSSAAIARFFSGFRPVTATRAPAARSPSAIARPSPPFPPVTTATRPSSEKSRRAVSSLPFRITPPRRSRRSEHQPADDEQSAPDEQRRPHDRHQATPVAGRLLHHHNAGQRQHPRQAADPDPEHHQHQRPAAAEAEEAVAQAEAPGRPEPAGVVAVEEAGRAPAFVQAAFLQRAELEAARDQ